MTSDDPCTQDDIYEMERRGLLTPERRKNHRNILREAAGDRNKILAFIDLAKADQREARNGVLEAESNSHAANWGRHEAELALRRFDNEASAFSGNDGASK